jgi:hypothetical protein
MKAYGGVDVQLQIFFISELVAGEVSAPRFCLVTFLVILPGTQSIKTWVGPRVCFDVLRNRNFFYATGNRTTILLSSSP